jgi:hypothetical protein
VAGPFYLGVGLIQALVRDGFDLGRHPLSLLANGPGGWVQTANFALSGVMVIAAAVGFSRAMRPSSRAASWLLGSYGAALLAAAVFRADPVDGFPPGTPAGFPTTLSAAGLLHFVAGSVAFLAIAGSCIAMAVAMWRRGTRSMALVSVFSGLAVFLGFFGPMLLATSAGIAGIWISVVVGWVWLGVLSVHLYRTSPDPDCA